MTELEIRNAMIEAGRRLYARNMLAAADGNISVRMSDQRILITPSGKAKAFLDVDQLAIIDINGRVVSGTPSGERLMHSSIYRACSLAQAVVHAHPPHAIAWSVSSPKIRELPADVLSEIILAVGRIPIVPYAPPTTKDMGNYLDPFLPTHRAMILERHGAVTWGETLEEAVCGMERVEHSAEILWLGRSLGRLRRLPAAEVRALREMRRKIGERIL